MTKEASKLHSIKCTYRVVPCLTSMVTAIQFRGDFDLSSDPVTCLSVVVLTATLCHNTVGSDQVADCYVR